MMISKRALRAAQGAVVGALLLAAPLGAASKKTGSRTWAADNGNGTYSNPLFYDEFSDPDIIRVGPDYYLTGTTMHTMPGLPVLHSRDLVNWKFLTYAFDRLDLGPDFRLEDGKDIYGGGIWAPCLRYHDGTFYIFANINRFGLQVYRAKDPKGPWAHNRITTGLHDISVLFDDDGKKYAVYGSTTIRIVQFNDDLTELVPGTDRVLITPDLRMGEGSHIYKINKKYYIVSAMPGGHVPMKCARADSLNGPWEVKTISELESQGIGLSYRVQTPRPARGAGAPGGAGRGAAPAAVAAPAQQTQAQPQFKIVPPDMRENQSLTLHQGGIVDTGRGEWWGWSMQDHNAIGRLTSLSPVTWVDGWPYFGLPGNLTRTPKLWVKPDTGYTGPVTSPYERNDDFSGPKLQPVLQWNHAPDETKWSLSERKGYLRLHTLPASDFWRARNSLTQRAIGPESSATAILDASGLKAGDVAGLALLNQPYNWIGVSLDNGKYGLELYDQLTGKSDKAALSGPRVWLRVHCNFDTDIAQYSYSINGKTFKNIGAEIQLPFQLRTFQGVRYTLFAYNGANAAGGYADFDSLTIDEPRPRGLTKPIPVGKSIQFTDIGSGASLAAVDGKLQAVAAGKGSAFQVVDRGKGRIALRTAKGEYVSVTGQGAAGEVVLKAGAPADSETFQWVDLQRGDTLLLSLVNHRYIMVPKALGVVSADRQSPAPDRKDGSCFTWKVASK